MDNYRDYTRRFKNSETQSNYPASSVSRGSVFGGLPINERYGERQPMQERGGTEQSRVVPQRGSYAGSPMSRPGNAGLPFERHPLPGESEGAGGYTDYGDITYTSPNVLRQQAQSRQGQQQPYSPPPGMPDNMPPERIDQAWDGYFDKTKKGFGLSDPVWERDSLNQLERSRAMAKEGSGEPGTAQSLGLFDNQNMPFAKVSGGQPQANVSSANIHDMENVEISYDGRLNLWKQEYGNSYDQSLFDEWYDSGSEDNFQTWHNQAYPATNNEGEEFVGKDPVGDIGTGGGETTTYTPINDIMTQLQSELEGATSYLDATAIYAKYKGMLDKGYGQTGGYGSGDLSKLATLQPDVNDPRWQTGGGDQPPADVDPWSDESLRGWYDNAVTKGDGRSFEEWKSAVLERRDAGFYDLNNAGTKITDQDYEQYKSSGSGRPLDDWWQRESNKRAGRAKSMFEEWQSKYPEITYDHWKEFEGSIYNDFGEWYDNYRAQPETPETPPEEEPYNELPSGDLGGSLDTLTGGLSGDIMKSIKDMLSNERMTGEELQQQYGTQFGDLERAEDREMERILQVANARKRLPSGMTLGEMATGTLPFATQRRDIITDVLAQDRFRQPAEQRANLSQAMGLMGQMTSEDQRRVMNEMQNLGFLTNEDQRMFQNMLTQAQFERTGYESDRSFNAGLVGMENQAMNNMPFLFEQPGGDNLYALLNGLQGNYQNQQGVNQYLPNMGEDIWGWLSGMFQNNGGNTDNYDYETDDLG